MFASRKTRASSLSNASVSARLDAERHGRDRHPPIPAAKEATSTSQIEAEVLRVQALMRAGRYDQALQAAGDLAGRVPENRDVIYMIAVSQRHLGRHVDALATLARLEGLHSRFSRLHQERGHCLAASGQPAAALDAFLHAVTINAALPASWNALEVLYRASRRPREAEMAAGHVAKLRSLAAEVVTASALFADDDTAEAERIIRAFLQTQPNDVEAMRLLARIGVRLEALDDAEFLLESVLAFSPAYQPARYDYVRVLLQRHQHQKALDQSRILLRADPMHRDYRAVYASARLSLGDYDEAIRVYRELAAEAPHAADLHLSIGHALKTQGRQQEAIASYRMAATVRPGFGDAYWSLANLKTYRFEPHEIAAMRTEEARAQIDPEDRAHLCFALGKALEDRGDFGSSFTFYARGNALKKATLGYRPEFLERNARLQETVCTSELLGRSAGGGCPRPDPIFIVGLPRAGSTLLEQILASHSQVEGTMELADISRIAARLQGRAADGADPRYPAILAELTDETRRSLGEKYLAETMVYRSGKPFFIDKNPNNFRNLGLIRLILPNARIIDARREPMACCFSNFKQLFAAGQEFTYSLHDIAHYYRLYVRLMAHWDRVMPGQVLRVQHEDVVADLEGCVRRMLDFCDLPFERQCIDFHRTERSVRTASSEQVRRPISREGLDQWVNFKPWLAPLEQALAGLD